MSPAYTFIAIGALIGALILLLLYYRAEARDAGPGGNGRLLPGKLFIVTLLACTFLGMAITESQGVCWLSPWGFIAGIILGAAAEIAAYVNFGK